MMSASLPEMEKNSSSGSRLVLVLTFGMEKEKLWMNECFEALWKAVDDDDVRR